MYTFIYENENYECTLCHIHGFYSDVEKDKTAHKQCLMVEAT